MDNKKKELLKIYAKNSTQEELFIDTLEKINKVDEKLTNFIQEKTKKEAVETLVKEIIPKVENGKPGKDGKTPTQEELLALIKPLIPPAIKGKDGNIITPEEIRDKLNELKGVDRLSVLSLKDLEWLKSKEGIQWSSAGFKVYTDSSLSGDGSFANPLKALSIGLSTVSHDTTLTGEGTQSNPLKVTAPGITSVYHDTSLTGSGTSGDPLSVVAQQSGDGGFFYSLMGN